KAVPPILMAGAGLHDLFTVFTFKTPPSGDFVYGREKNGRAGSPSTPRRFAFAYNLMLRNRSENQIAEPITMRDSRAIRSERFHRGIHAQIAVRAIGVLPALVPVKRRFESRITGAEKFQTLVDPRRFAH